MIGSFVFVGMGARRWSSSSRELPPIKVMRATSVPIVVGKDDGCASTSTSSAMRSNCIRTSKDRLDNTSSRGNLHEARRKGSALPVVGHTKSMVNEPPQDATSLSETKAIARRLLCCSWISSPLQPPPTIALVVPIAVDFAILALLLIRLLFVVTRPSLETASFAEKAVAEGG